jgi:hypothetical protein
MITEAEEIDYCGSRQHRCSPLAVDAQNDVGSFVDSNPAYLEKGDRVILELYK